MTQVQNRQCAVPIESNALTPPPPHSFSPPSPHPSPILPPPILSGLRTVLSVITSIFTMYVQSPQ